MISTLTQNSITRRSFVKVSAALTAAAGVLGRIKPASAAEWRDQLGSRGTKPDPISEDVRIVRSVCLMCHGGCGLQAKIKGGELIKLDGNPFHPNCYDYSAKGDLAAESDLDGGPAGKDVASLCPKGNAGVFALYNPARLTHPLKRVGPRGSGQWKKISWEEAMEEILNGGRLFKDVPGEEKRHVDGLNKILNDNSPLGPEDSAYMDEAPPAGWGPKRNQFVWMHGRNEQSPLTPRFVKEVCGVPHMLNHCARCAGTFYNVIEDVLNLPPYEIGAYADLPFTSYLISIGSNITAADYPMQLRTRKLQKWAKRLGPYAKEFKHVVVDPWLSSGAAKATHNGKGEWIPIKPAADAFFLVGMIRWIIDNEKFNREYLRLPNEKSAKAAGRRNWTDMTYLVKQTEPKTYLTAAEAGLPVQADYVVMAGGSPTAFHEAEGPADLDASVTIKGIPCKTVFRMLKERAREKTLEECDRLCDIPKGTIARLSREFTSAKTPVIEMFRGPVQQTNGWWNGQALCIINMLVDNIDRRGGFSPGHAAYKGKVGGTLRKPEGVPVDCAKKYEGKKPVPTRPWYPLARRTVTPNFLSNLKHGYPYKIKAILNYYNDPAYTMPHNAPVIENLKNTDLVPLLFSIDAYMGETSSLADYILPDTEYLERFGGFKTYPPVNTQVWGLRQPVVGELDPKTHEYRGVHPDARMADDVLIEIGIRCGLPGFGKNGGGDGIDLMNSWDYWNEYYKHEDFKDGLDPNSDFVKMGGKFENPTKEYDGEYCRFPGGRPVRALFAYQQKVATTKNCMTGSFFDGLPTYRGIFDCTEQPLDPKLWAEYPFALHTHKDAWHTQSRTAQNLWLMSIQPQNFAEINPAEAVKLGVVTGDWVRVKSPSSIPVKEYANSLGDGWYKFQVRVTSRVRPGVFSVSQSYGRWGAGARMWYVNGKPQYQDDRIGAGFHINPLYMADPVLKDRILMDPVAGGTQSYGTPLRVERL